MPVSSVAGRLRASLRHSRRTGQVTHTFMASTGRASRPSMKKGSGSIPAQAARLAQVMTAPAMRGSRRGSRARPPAGAGSIPDGVPLAGRLGSTRDMARRTSGQPTDGWNSATSSPTGDRRPRCTQGCGPPAVRRTRRSTPRRRRSSSGSGRGRGGRSRGITAVECFALGVELVAVQRPVVTGRLDLRRQPLTVAAEHPATDAVLALALPPRDEDGRYQNECHDPAEEGVRLCRGPRVGKDDVHHRYAPSSSAMPARSSICAIATWNSTTSSSISGAGIP